MDFTQTPPGMLALDNMLYFAKHHQDAYVRVSTWPTGLEFRGYRHGGEAPWRSGPRGLALTPQRSENETNETGPASSPGAA